MLYCQFLDKIHHKQYITFACNNQNKLGGEPMLQCMRTEMAEPLTFSNFRELPKSLKKASEAMLLILQAEGHHPFINGPINAGPVAASCSWIDRSDTEWGLETQRRERIVHIYPWGTASGIYADIHLVGHASRHWDWSEQVAWFITIIRYYHTRHMLFAEYRFQYAGSVEDWQMWDDHLALTTLRRVDTDGQVHPILQRAHAA
jgi:hypothetical protein